MHIKLTFWTASHNHSISYPMLFHFVRREKEKRKRRKDRWMEKCVGRKGKYPPYIHTQTHSKRILTHCLPFCTWFKYSKWVLLCASTETNKIRVSKRDDLIRVEALETIPKRILMLKISVGFAYGQNWTSTREKKTHTHTICQNQIMFETAASNQKKKNRGLLRKT